MSHKKCTHYIQTERTIPSHYTVWYYIIFQLRHSSPSLKNLPGSGDGDGGGGGLLLSSSPFLSRSCLVKRFKFFSSTIPCQTIQSYVDCRACSIITIIITILGTFPIEFLEKARKRKEDGRDSRDGSQKLWLELKSMGKGREIKCLHSRTVISIWKRWRYIRTQRCVRMHHRNPGIHEKDFDKSVYLCSLQN